MTFADVRDLACELLHSDTGSLFLVTAEVRRPRRGRLHPLTGGSQNQLWPMDGLLEDYPNCCILLAWGQEQGWPWLQWISAELTRPALAPCSPAADTASSVAQRRLSHRLAESAASQSPPATAVAPAGRLVRHHLPPLPHRRSPRPLDCVRSCFLSAPPERTSPTSHNRGGMAAAAEITYSFPLVLGDVCFATRLSERF